MDIEQKTSRSKNSLRCRIATNDWGTDIQIYHSEYIRNFIRQLKTAKLLMEWGPIFRPTVHSVQACRFPLPDDLVAG